MKLPKIRENLLVQNLDGEALIYDATTNKYYCLNSTAQIVFDACDGTTGFAALKMPDELIFFTLDELKKHNLIEDNYLSPFVGTNRREVIKKVGLGTMIALPIISGLVAPTAAAAASLGNCSSICIGPGQNVCAGCIGTVTFVSYRAVNGGCTGAINTTFQFNCTASPANSGSFYHQRN